MDLLTSIKFVLGAVSKKELVPVLNHFLIKDGRIQGHNGILTISSPIDIGIEAMPKAETFYNAITKCDGSISLTLTEKGRLSIKSGKFRAYIECYNGEDKPNILPTGEKIEVNGNVLLEAFRALLPIVGTDASRPWCLGVLIKENKLYATNNILVCEYTLPDSLPVTINIPREALIEILRVKETFTHLQIDDKNVVFHYSGGKYIRAQLLSSQWPNLSRFLTNDNNYQPIPEELFTGLDKIKPFLGPDEIVHFLNNLVTTDKNETNGATYTVQGVVEGPSFSFPMLMLLKSLATHVAFDAYPNPLPFKGDKVRGVISVLTF